MKFCGMQDDLSSDVLVVGSGPAGVAAAVRASEQGARVLVIDDNPRAGGQIWRDPQSEHHGLQARRWFNRLTQSNIRFLPSTQIIGGSASSRSLLLENLEGSAELPFQKLVIATGARELSLPFPGWTLPGVMGAGGLQALVKSGLPVKGKKVILGGSGPLLLAVAAHLRKFGASVKLIAEQASRSAVLRFGFRLFEYPGKLLQAAGLVSKLASVHVHHNCWVTAAEGNGRLECLHFIQNDKTWTERCDYAGIGYGLYPNAEVASLLGCRMNGPAVAIDERQQSSIDGVYCAGECTGVGGVDLSLIEGEIAGYTACGRHDRAKHLLSRRTKARLFVQHLDATFALRPELKSLARQSTIVCRCEDVTFEQLSSYTSFRAAKLQRRCGMGPCQGRICGPATEFLFGWRAGSVRPPLFPARFESLSTSSHEVPTSA